ncbi:MAG: NAD-dependent epimerase/dehydratase family protein [Bacteroidota bacterium]
MAILLLGATGFVGRNISKVFDGRGIPLLKSSKSEGLDLLNLQNVVDFFKSDDIDYIINCAAHVGSLNYVSQHAADVIKDNSRMLLNLYEATSLLKKKPVIINPIANCTYPSSSNIFTEEELWNGPLHRSVMAYGSTKRLLLNIAESFSWQHNIKSINLLVPNMYGPFDSTDPNKAHALNALISKFVKAREQNKSEIDIWGTGVAIREWLYAEDFAKIVFEIVDTNKTIGFAEPINIGQNFGLSVKELVEIINGKFQNKFLINWDLTMPDGAPKKVMDDRKFTKVFPDFKFQDFNLGIENTIKYYHSVYPY